MTALAAPTPAQAAPPAVAQTWNTLMYRSLTRQQTAATMQATIATQKATVVTRTSEVTNATNAGILAESALTTATSTDTTAKTRVTAAQTALTTAKQNLTKANKKKPRSTAAITKAKNAVTAATKTLTTRQAEAKQSGTALTTAKTNARTATATLATAIANRDAAAAAVTVSVQKLALLPTAYSLATQATGLSRDVVTQTRAGFAVADTVQVYGITVHRSVAYAFKRMLDDARANGIVLSGGGFRTKERQIELRKSNGCPDVWSAPSSSCRVPTAIPGRSLHELGMAIDISQNGKTLTRTSTGYKWLVAHAKAYGFINLPSEPWHWSITGG
ncbi:M15 family metallopeptidase [Actinoplanes sp. LDG1-01]|uniref:M15 family metallopeptidase n=2 Tax=Paractinoplanes lichenicola TaxID=2802976 RepID=A0ABS1W3A5_9ACTN|nr:M15 family metallopeptidase [Actinoplanes lichenicola]